MKLADYLSEGEVSPSELARRAGTAVSTVTRFLSGKRGIGLAVAQRIVQATDGKVTLADLAPSLHPEPEAEAAA